MIKVVNKKTYVEQGNPLGNKKFTFYIGRPSILGNPYTHFNTVNTLAKYKVDTREDAINKYKKYFYETLETNHKFEKEVNWLVANYLYYERLILVCWCSPLSCHGDVIKEYIEDYISIV